MLSVEASLFGLLVGATLPGAAVAHLPSLISQGDGILDVSSKAWESALNSPNATGEFDITGFNVSKTWPGTKIDGWSLHVNVSADVASEKEVDMYFTGTAIQLTPPSELVEKAKNGTESIAVGKGWEVCATVLSSVEGVDLTDDFGDDGSCGKLLGETCIKDIQQAAAGSLGGSSCGDWINSLDSCKDFNAASWSIPLNESKVLSDATFASTTNKTHKAGDTAAYEEVVKSTIPIVLSWGGSDSTDQGHSSGSVSDLEDRTTVMCIRADETTKGSREVKKDDSKDSAGSKPTFATVGVISAALAVAMAL